MNRRQILQLTLLSIAAPARAGQNVPDYREIIPLFWRALYGKGGESLYCGERFGSGGNRKLNIEHVMPMAWAMNEFGCDDRQACRRKHPRFRRIEADLHNLYPARRDLNRERGSSTFGMIPGEARRFGPDCDFEVDYQRHRVEPRPAARGEIARALFYMSDRWGIPLRPKLVKLLRQWNRADPVSAVERRRNDVIEQLQGQRNRFIDDPGAVHGRR